jgi:hypothetical protein
MSARHELWRRGNLSWKLSESQQPIYSLFEKIRKSRHKKGFVRTSRRFGKTHSFLTFASERCIVEPGILIPYVAPTIKHLKTVVIPIMGSLAADCPKQLRPRFNSQDGTFTFAGSAKILLGAAENNHAEKFRGIRAKYALLDEIGVISDLRYLVNDIMLPTLMYDDGFMVGSGTPPSSPDHYYTEMLMECEANGLAVHKTIWENDRITIKEILEFADASGCVVDWERFSQENSPARRRDVAWGKALILEKSTTFRREFEAEIVIDENWAVLPEFTDSRAERIVKEWKLPEFYFPYVFIDTGFIDFTGVIFGYWDFLNAKAVVQDELLVDFRRQEMNAKKFSELVLAKERELWGEVKTYLRFADGDLIVLNELGEHGLIVQQVTKDEIEAQVNTVRVDITQDKLVIQPRCVNTIAQCRYAVWNRQRRAFARTENHGHYDLLAALIYFLRHINRSANPWPENYGATFNHYVSARHGRQTGADSLRKIFNR